MGNETIQRPWRRFWGQSSLGVLPRSCKFFPQFSVINLCLFCLKEKKKILAFPCMQSTTKDIFFSSQETEVGCVARHWRARLLCCGSGSTATPLGLTELPLDARPGQGYGPKGVSPLQVSLQDSSWSVPCELPPGSSIVIYCIRFNSYAHKTFTEYHNYLSQTNGKYFLKQIV